MLMVDSWHANCSDVLKFVSGIPTDSGI